MKKLIAGIALFGTFAVATAQTISFDKTTIEYGTVQANSDGSRFFTVTNTGDKPLIISNVKPSCGCTTPEFSTDPIMPGKSTKIKVGYNTAIVGSFNKNIEVFSNDAINARSILYIKGTVEPKVETTTAVSVAPAVEAVRRGGETVGKAVSNTAKSVKKGGTELVNKLKKSTKTSAKVNASVN